MANRVTMSICGTEYILVAEEDAAYMEKIGNMVDAEMQKLMDSAHMSRDAAAVLAAGFAAGQLLRVDYGGWGVLLVLLFYMSRQAKGKLVIQLLGLGVFCWLCSPWRGQLLALLAMLPIALYNGERGFSGKALQYGFYAFYPVHILILSVLAQYVF